MRRQLVAECTPLISRRPRGSILATEHKRWLARGACVAGLAFLGAPRVVERTAPSYTVAFKSFAPNNTDIFIADADGRNAHPLVPDPALDYDASFSADGRWIVFTSHRSGTARIYRVHPDGSGLEPLTDGSAFADQGALSPDGKTLAFVSSRSGQADIWVLDLATRTLRDVTTHPAGDFRPAWAPNGKWIAFSSDRDPPHTACPNTTAPGPAPFVTPQYTAVYIMHPDGSGLRRISAATEIAGTPHWSPDGARIAFWTGDPDQVCKGGLIFGTGATNIATVDVTSGARTSVTSGAGVKVFPRWRAAAGIAYQTRGGIRFTNADAPLDGEFQAPDWSPDHRAMVFHRETDPRGDRDRPFQSWPSLDAQFRLLRVPDASSFSPAGDRMVYMLTNFAGAIRSGTLIVANADGSDRRAIYAGPLSEDMTGPAWSPRGDSIAFGSGSFFQRAQIGAARLSSVAVDGSGLTYLTTDSINAGMPSWSPDGRQVVFRRATGSKRHLYILDVGTRSIRKLETGSDFDTFPTWSPRGDWIAFTSKRDNDYEIYRIRPDGTGLQRLTTSPGNDAHPAFSPDGEWIAFATARQGAKDEAVQLLLAATFQPYGEIAVMRDDGSDVRLLTDNSTEEGAPAWLPLPRPAQSFQR
jgi:Tol biopolymer transport system component